MNTCTEYIAADVFFKMVESWIAIILLYDTLMYAEDSFGTSHLWSVCFNYSRDGETPCVCRPNCRGLCGEKVPLGSQSCSFPGHSSNDSEISRSFIRSLEWRIEKECGSKWCGGFLLGGIFPGEAQESMWKWFVVCDKWDIEEYWRNTKHRKF